MRYAVRPEFVAQCITELRQLKIHRTFAGYLAVRWTAFKEGRTKDLQIDWKGFFDAFFRIPGAPQGKPYLVPFSESAPTESNKWFNTNVAGSYSPASLRDISPFRQVIDIDNSKRGGRYSLKDDELPLVRKHMLYSQQVPVFPFSAFLFRDYAFQADNPEPSDIIDAMYDQFGFGIISKNPEDNIMTGIPLKSDDNWFEEVPEMSSPESETQPEKFRALDADTLGLVSESVEEGVATIGEEDEVLNRVQQLMDDGFAGVIFTGPPGTSKSWYADQIARFMTDNDPDLIRYVQFHASYQYEDFVEGYVPRKDGTGFDLRPKHLLEMCEKARKAGDKLCVMVIDELSRSDPARVFGEALTYIEGTKRDHKFKLASGTEESIPANLFFLATMNPMDRGVDEVDAALERRFAKIAMDPDAENLRSHLLENGLPEDLVTRIINFFTFVNAPGNKNTYSRIGHAYFYGVRNEDGLRRLWQNQLSFVFEKAYRMDSDGLAEVERRWGRVFANPAPGVRVAEPEVPGTITPAEIVEEEGPR